MGIVDQIGAAIRHKGWSRTAAESGVDRTQLHNKFGENRRGGPTLRLIERVLPTLGLELTLTEKTR